MANFPSGSWAAQNLTLQSQAQGIYTDGDGYYYQDSGDNATIYDLGAGNYIDYNGKVIATPATSSSSGFWNSLGNALGNALGKYVAPPTTTVTNAPKKTTNNITPTNVNLPTSSSTYTPIIILGVVVLLGVGGFYAYKKMKK